MNKRKFEDHLWLMDAAIKEANIAYTKGEVPVGAIITNAEGTILASAHNLKEKNHDPCAHAEILALQAAGKKLNNWRLSGCMLYVTLEPCAMCLGAMIHARIDTLIFGAYDKKAGALSIDLNIHQNKKLNHQISVIGGVSHFETSRILSNFFREKRIAQKSPL